MRLVGASNLSADQWKTNVLLQMCGLMINQSCCLFWDSSKNLKKPIRFPIFRYFYLLGHHFTEWFLKDITRKSEAFDKSQAAAQIKKFKIIYEAILASFRLGKHPYRV